MNNEIKEILDRLDYEEWEVDLYKVPITWCELYTIRDYITNLQQENQELNKENEKWWAIIKDNEQEIKDLCLENSKLEQENERLKIQNELLKDPNINEILKKDLEICAKQYKKSEEKLEKYKSRIEKAVELTQNLLNTENSGYYKIIFQKQLDTLNGRNDE